MIKGCCTPECVRWKLDRRVCLGAPTSCRSAVKGCHRLSGCSAGLPVCLRSRLPVETYLYDSILFRSVASVRPLGLRCPFDLPHPCTRVSRCAGAPVRQIKGLICRNYCSDWPGYILLVNFTNNLYFFNIYLFRINDGHKYY